MKNLKDTNAFKEFKGDIKNRPENEQKHLIGQYEDQVKEQEERAKYFDKVFNSGLDDFKLDMKTAKWMFVAKAKEYDKDFEAKLNAEYYQQLIDHLFDETEKGLYIYGNVGSGKSLGIIAASQVKPTPNQINARFRTENQLIEDYQADKELFKTYRKGGLIIDDLGTNQKEWKVDVIRALLEDRYLLFKRDKKKTYLTTNLKPESLAEHFGIRVMDRIKEMCEHIEVIQKSLRK